MYLHWGDPSLSKNEANGFSLMSPIFVLNTWTPSSRKFTGGETLTNFRNILWHKKTYKLTLFDMSAQAGLFLVKIRACFTFFSTWVLAFLPTVAKAVVFSKKADNWQASLEILGCILCSALHGGSLWKCVGRECYNRCVQIWTLKELDFTNQLDFSHLKILAVWR